MSRRTSQRKWRGLELITDWMARQQEPLCACGCGERIKLKRHHRHAGIPMFAVGHHARARLGNYKGVDLWVREQQGKHLCECGCGGEIRVHPRHHAIGVPRFMPNHSPRPRLGMGSEHPRYIQDRSLARRPRAFPSWVKDAAIKLHGGRCAWCGATDPLEVDHVVPASLGGEPTLENAQVLCANCHRWKSAIEPVSRVGKTPLSRSRKPKEVTDGCHR